jgi:two-component sensor histidine kinase/ABC-type branched-subunit amino acid transport system ATPase component
MCGGIILPKSIFEIKNLTYNSPDGYIDNINLNLGYAEIHALIVKNSLEQSVFLQSIMNLLDNHGANGEIRFKDKILNGKKIIKKEVSLLHHKPLLIDNLSIAENLNLTNVPTRRFLPFIDWGKIRSKSIFILEKLDFQFNYSTKVKKLSEENKKIVYISGVFLQNPEVIIMHEPMEGLSAKNVSKLYNIIKQYKEDGGSVIYVTKQWEDALKIADRISILSKGRIIDEMSAEDAKSDPIRLLRELGNYNFVVNDKFRDDDTQSVLDAVFKAAEFLTSEYELKDVLLLLAKEVTKIMNADSCSIKLIDEYTWSIIDDFEFKNRELQAQLTKDAIIRIAKENNIFYANQNDKEFNSMFEKINNVKTIICIPVLIRKQVTGIIQLSYEKFYVYSKEEFKYLSTLAHQAAIAIEDTRLMGRSALLQESHHRIKNNLQSIVGLIELQKMFVQNNPDISIDDLFDSIVNRIKSIASVHNLMSKDKLGRSIINVKKIIETIIDFINNDTSIHIHLDLDDIFIPYNKATSIALIINELVINCFKHAFIDMDSGIIEIKLKRMDEHIFLSVSDNGRGLPKNFDFNKVDSLGISILQGIITNDFQGEMLFITRTGTTVEIKLPTQKIFHH